MAGEHEAIVVYGTTWCPDCERAKQFFGDHRVHYHWVDIERDAEAPAYVEEVDQGKRIVPIIVFPDGSIPVTGKPPRGGCAAVEPAVSTAGG